MQYTVPNLIPAIPEIFLLTMICVTLLVDLFVQQRHRTVTFYLAELSIFGAALITIYLFNYPDTYTFYGMYVHDKIASLLEMVIYITSFFALFYARDYIRDNKMQEGEYYVLALLSILGMVVLVAANSLLVLFLGLELLSLPIYAMVAFKKDSSHAAEAAMKYYVVGAMATGFLLYGISIIYGVTDSLNIPHIASVIATSQGSYQVILAMALVFVIAGVAFKLGAAPFHMWAPDVYQGAPAPVTLFIGSAPKVAAVGMIIRLLIEALPGLHIQWQELLIVIAFLSMGLGNIVAIVQTNIKRMLAYSSIAHMGYMSLGLIANTPEGYATSVFYIIIYAITSMGAFGIITLMSKAGIDAENIEDYRGLNSRSPWLAFMMLLIMFSMAGIPPTVGFFAKLGVLEAIVSAHMVWLAVVALIFAVIGSYYYLAIVKVMYFEDPKEVAPVAVRSDMALAISVNSIAVLLLGLFPTTLIDLCRAAFF